jgi:hypothetical protein
VARETSLNTRNTFSAGTGEDRQVAEQAPVHAALTSRYQEVCDSGATRKRALLALYFSKASDLREICEVPAARLPIGVKCRNGTRASRAHPAQATYRSAPASRELNA